MNTKVALFVLFGLTFAAAGVTVAQLQAIMQNKLPYPYINDLNAVLSQYNLNTPKRMAGFLAQVDFLTRNTVINE